MTHLNESAMRRTALSRRLAFAGIALGAFALAAPVAWSPAVTSALAAPGDDEGDGKDGEDGEDGADGADGADGGAGGEGAEAPTGPAPTMDTAVEQSDPKRLVSIKLPKEWKVHKFEEQEKSTLIAFEGPYTARDNGLVVLVEDRSNSRALLALHTVLGAEGALVPERTRTGAGFAEGCVVEESGNPPRTIYMRFVEKDGRVYSVHVLGHKNSKDRMHEMAQKILDTFKVVGKPVAAALPAGFALKKQGEYDAVTDADKGGMGKVGRVADLCAGGREGASKALKGKPFDESRPVLRAFQDAGKFVDETKPIFGEAPERCAFDAGNRCAYVTLYRADDDDFPWQIRYVGAQQYVFQYFGGRAPHWLLAGLSMYGAAAAEAGGKPEKLSSERIKLTKEKAKADKGLDEWMAVRSGAQAADDETTNATLLAWHWFIRHGPGKKYRKPYEASIEHLRATGDAKASRAAWDGTDFAAMKKEFGDFLLRWE